MIAAVAVLQQHYTPRAALAVVGVNRFDAYTRSLHLIGANGAAAWPSAVGTSDRR